MSGQPGTAPPRDWLPPENPEVPASPHLTARLLTNITLWDGLWYISCLQDLLQVYKGFDEASTGLEKVIEAIPKVHEER